MNQASRVLNVALIALGFFGGYMSLDPDSIRETNSDLILYLMIIVVVPMVMIFGIYYSVARLKVTELRRPSWERIPLRLWYDPLQYLFTITFVCLAAMVGSGLHSWLIDWAGIWISELFGAMVVGLLIARVIAYRIFQNRIV